MCEYFLDGFDAWEDFDRVLDELILLGAGVAEKTADIYSRSAGLGYEQMRFALIFHEDVGLYALVLEPRTDAAARQLGELLERAMKSAASPHPIR